MSSTRANIQAIAVLNGHLLFDLGEAPEQDGGRRRIEHDQQSQQRRKDDHPGLLVDLYVRIPPADSPDPSRWRLCIPRKREKITKSFGCRAIVDNECFRR
jgi:hypothetical protein